MHIQHLVINIALKEMCHSSSGQEHAFTLNTPCQVRENSKTLKKYSKILKY